MNGAGMSRREIAKESGISRNAVGSMLKFSTITGYLVSFPSKKAILFPVRRPKQ